MALLCVVGVVAMAAAAVGGVKLAELLAAEILGDVWGA